MTQIASLSVEKTSYTAKLFDLAKPLFDPTVDLIHKIGVLILSAIVIPIAVPFTLILDGFFFLFPNLAQKRENSPDETSPIPQIGNSIPIKRANHETSPMDWEIIQNLALAAITIGAIGAVGYTSYRLGGAETTVIGSVLSTKTMEIVHNRFENSAIYPPHGPNRATNDLMTNPTGGLFEPRTDGSSSNSMIPSVELGLGLLTAGAFFLSLLTRASCAIGGPRKLPFGLGSKVEDQSAVLEPTLNTPACPQNDSMNTPQLQLTAQNRQNRHLEKDVKQNQISLNQLQDPKKSEQNLKQGEKILQGAGRFDPKGLKNRQDESKGQTFTAKTTPGAQKDASSFGGEALSKTVSSGCFGIRQEVRSLQNTQTLTKQKKRELFQSIQNIQTVFDVRESQSRIEALETLLNNLNIEEFSYLCNESEKFWAILQDPTLKSATLCLTPEKLEILAQAAQKNPTESKKKALESILSLLASEVEIQDRLLAIASCGLPSLGLQIKGLARKCQNGQVAIKAWETAKQSLITQATAATLNSPPPSQRVKKTFQFDLTKKPPPPIERIQKREWDDSTLIAFIQTFQKQGPDAPEIQNSLQTMDNKSIERLICLLDGDDSAFEKYLSYENHHQNQGEQTINSRRHRLEIAFSHFSAAQLQKAAQTQVFWTLFSHRRYRYYESAAKGFSAEQITMLIQQMPIWKFLQGEPVPCRGNSQDEEFRKFAISQLESLAVFIEKFPFPEENSNENLDLFDKFEALSSAIPFYKANFKLEITDIEFTTSLYKENKNIFALISALKSAVQQKQRFCRLQKGRRQLRAFPT